MRLILYKNGLIWSPFHKRLFFSSHMIQFQSFQFLLNFSFMWSSHVQIVLSRIISCSQISGDDCIHIMGEMFKSRNPLFLKITLVFKCPIAPVQPVKHSLSWCLLSNFGRWLWVGIMFLYRVNISLSETNYLQD